MAKELTPCPFCGNVPKVLETVKNYLMIKCTNRECLIRPDTKAYKHLRSARRAWNRRRSKAIGDLANAVIMANTSVLNDKYIAVDNGDWQTINNLINQLAAECGVS